MSLLCLYVHDLNVCISAFCYLNAGVCDSVQNKMLLHTQVMSHLFCVCMYVYICIDAQCEYTLCLDKILLVLHYVAAYCSIDYFSLLSVETGPL